MDNNQQPNEPVNNQQQPNESIIINIDPAMQRAEYAEVCQNFRHYSTLRFAILTVFLALMTILITPIFATDVHITPSSTIIIKVLGLLSTFLFFLFSHTCAEHLRLIGLRAKAMEQELNFRNLGSRYFPPWYLKIRHGVSLFYASIFVFWLLSLVISN